MIASGEIQTLGQMYQYAAHEYGEKKAFGFRYSAECWDYLSYKQVFEKGRALATALIDYGLRKQEPVVIFSDNRVEWMIADYGIQIANAVCVPRGADVTLQEMEYILDHTRARFVFIENENLYLKIKRIPEHILKSLTIILLDPSIQPPQETHRAEDWVARGEILREKGNRKAEERLQEQRETDLYSIIYTSGTTGVPRGVMLTHKNILFEIKQIPVPISTEDRVLSVLPVWHVFERVLEMLTIAGGGITYYSGIYSLETDFPDVKPTYIGSAPRLLDLFYNRAQMVLGIASGNIWNKALVRIALMRNKVIRFFTGRCIDDPKESFIRSAAFSVWGVLFLLIQMPMMPFTAVLKRKIKKRFGGELKALVSGGGALSLRTDLFFQALSVTVLEGYGMTETSPVISLRTFENNVPGTVGRPLAETEVRIMEPSTAHILYPDPYANRNGAGRIGEIQVKGPHVMKGYYKDIRATTKMISEDGWLKTGDLGMFTWNGNLKIVGRMKETIVLNNGENIEPAPIERKLKESRFIEQAIVVGQDRKALSALILPSIDWFKIEGISSDGYSTLAESKQVRRTIESEIDRLISAETGFKPHERIHRFHLMHRPLMENVELSGLYKPKRHVIEKTFKKEIDGMYD